MIQWSRIYRKEMLEMWRNYKWVWIPLVFIFLGVMQPISSYYMPMILDKVGGLPEGAVIQIPLPTGPEVLAKTLSQYGTLGVLILVLSLMGIVANERERGVVGLILVKPVSYFNYISAKWIGAFTLTAISFLFGYLATWYYTNTLIEAVDFVFILNSFLIYLLWLLFVITVTLFMSTFLKGNGTIAFLSILLVAGLSLVTNIATNYLNWSPARLSSHAAMILTKGDVGPDFVLCLIVTGVIIIGFLIGSVQLFKSSFHTP